MSGGNITIGQFNTTTTAMAAGDSVAAYQATASTTVRFLASQVSANFIVATATSCSTGVVSYLASTPAGFMTVSINGTSFKLPYFNV